MTDKVALEAAKTSLQRTLDQIRGPLWQTAPEAATIRAREEVYEDFRPLFQPAAIRNLSKEDFHRFLSFKNNRHWRGLHRLGPAITSDMNRLREGLAILLDEGRPVRDRLNTLGPAEGDSYVRKLGRAIITPILHIAYPDRYGVWNNPVRDGLRLLGIYPKADGRGLGDRYVPINEVLLELSRELDIDLWTLDSLWHPVASLVGDVTVREGEASGYSVGGRRSEGGTAPAFSAETFRILGELRAEPTQTFVQTHAEELDRLVESPFKALLHRVVELLPAEVKAPLETEKSLFSRFNKNDYGRGGAWHYLWGALYPKGGRRITGIQLFVYVTHDRFEYGLAFGQHAGETTDSFVSACRQNATRLADLMRPRLDGLGFRFGVRGHTPLPPKEDPDGAGVPLEKWLEDPRAHSLEIRNPISASEAAETSLETLAERVAEGFVALFPLVLLAIAPDPLPAAVAFASEELLDDEQNEDYPIARVTEASGLDEDVLEQWVQAIHRKGQAILYGPPGTGKTFLARLLAKHLAGGGNGFTELVQFHPAYAYEDFIQGIRPRAGRGDATTFDLVSGRFLEFCSKAAQTDGTCVLIIDEINRANLSRVMGELMYLLEYRSERIPLAGGGWLMIPPNVRLIGTMNTADRSIALVDHALRRRFAFLRLAPNYTVLQKFHSSEPELANRLIDVLKDVNRSINDPHYEVGITFFLVNSLRDHLPQIWRMEIEPYLEEYFFDRSSAATEFGWERVRQQLEM